MAHREDQDIQTHKDTENTSPNGPASFEPDHKQLPPPPDRKLLVSAEPQPDETQSPPAGEPPGKKPRRWKWWWIVLALAVLALIGFYFFRSKGPATGTKGLQPVGAAITAGQSKTGNINIYVQALGTVTPIFTVTLYSQITGQIIAVHYREGQMVKKGDPLIDIDPRPYQTLLTQAEGTLQRDVGVLQEASMDLARYQLAFEKNAIAKQQLDDQAAAVVQDEGTVKADQGTVDYDRVELSYCHIVSPITGRVGLRLVDPGNTVFAGSGATLVVITQLQPITIVFNVSEDDLPQVEAQLHGTRELQVDAFDRADEKEIEAGKLTSLDNEVDTTTGTVKFRAEFPNRNLKLFPNQFVNARLLVRTLRNVTLVPSAAVQHNGTTAFVYIVNSNNKVSVQNVTTETSNDQETAVQGLNAGVKVVTSGFDRLENGTLVAVNGQQAQQNNPGHGSTSGTGGTLSPATNPTPTRSVAP